MLSFFFQCMAKRTGSLNRKTRTKSKKFLRTKGKISLTRYMQKFEMGSIVSIGLEPAIKTMRSHPRFIGRTGRVVGIRGKCYEVSIRDGGKEKKLIIHPIHLKRA